MPANVESLRCDCGAVMMTVRGEPAARSFCHCHACRDLYGSIFIAATLWSPEQVIVTAYAQALCGYAHPLRDMHRHFCRHCGELLYGQNNMGLIVIPNARFARQHDRGLPARLSPAMHLFYEARACDIDDDLPKYREGEASPLYA